MLKAAARALLVGLGYRPPGREVGVFADDIFIVSYPKSGNTWLRFLVASLVCDRHGIGFNNIDEVIPDIYQCTEKSLRKRQRPRIIKSHEYFDRRYGRVIYIVRDPRDVAVSYFYHHLKQRLIPEDRGFERFVERFLAGTLDPYGSWQEHVGSWLGARSGRDDFLLLRYEDLSRTAEDELKRVAEFLDLQLTETRLRRAVEQCSFEEMRRLERRQAHRTSTLKSSRQDIGFVRSATVGGWQQELAPALAARIVERWGGTMAELDYAQEQRARPCDLT
jgi:hypothetical protein